MRRTSLGILAATFSGMALAACSNTPLPNAQNTAPTPVVAGTGSTPVTSGLGNAPVTGGFHNTEGAPTTQP